MPSETTHTSNSPEAGLREALEHMERIRGPEHADVAWPLMALADYLRGAGRWEEALQLYTRALHIREEALGEQHLEVAKVYNAIGSLHRARGLYADAEPFFRHALEIRQRIAGPRSELAAASLNNLGALYHSLGRYREADQLVREALEIRESIYGTSDPRLASCVTNLAVVQGDLGEYRSARDTAERSLSLRSGAVPPDDVERALSLIVLSGALGRLGEWQEAERLARQALAIRQKQLGAAHSSVAGAQLALAEVMLDTGRVGVALASASEALEIRRAQLPALHPDITQAELVLARAMAAGSMKDEAASQLEHLAAEAGDPDQVAHPIAANIWLAMALARGDAHEALAAAQTALSIRERLLGTAHPASAEAATVVAHQQVLRGDLDGACDRLQGAIDVLAGVLPEGHPTLRSARADLALCMINAGDLPKAAAELRLADRRLAGAPPSIDVDAAVEAMREQCLTQPPPVAGPGVAVQPPAPQAGPGAAAPLWSEAPAPDAQAIPFDMPDPEPDDYRAAEPSHQPVDHRADSPSPETYTDEIAADPVEPGDEQAAHARGAPLLGGGAAPAYLTAGHTYDLPSNQPDQAEIRSEAVEPLDDLTAAAWEAPLPEGGAGTSTPAADPGYVVPAYEPQTTPDAEEADGEHDQPRSDLAAGAADTISPEPAPGAPYAFDSDSERTDGGSEQVATPPEPPFDAPAAGAGYQQAAGLTADAPAPTYTPPVIVSRRSDTTPPAATEEAPVVPDMPANGHVQGPAVPAPVWRKAEHDEPEPVPEWIEAPTGHAPGGIEKSISWSNDEVLRAEDAETARMVDDGDLAGADVRIADLLRRRTAKSGANSPEAADAMMLMGRLRSAQGRHQEAASLFRHSLAIHRASAAPDDGAVASALSRLAGEITRIDGPGAVRDLVDTELKRLQRRYGVESRQYAARAQNLAILCQAASVDPHE